MNGKTIIAPTTYFRQTFIIRMTEHSTRTRCKFSDKVAGLPIRRSCARGGSWLKGEGSIVLSLWVRGGLIGPCQPDSSLPTQFVLSPDGAEILLRELHKTLEQ